MLLGRNPSHSLGSFSLAGGVEGWAGPLPGTLLGTASCAPSHPLWVSQAGPGVHGATSQDSAGGRVDLVEVGWLGVCSSSSVGFPKNKTQGKGVSVKSLFEVTPGRRSKGQPVRDVLGAWAGACGLYPRLSHQRAGGSDSSPRHEGLFPGVLAPLHFGAALSVNRWRRRARVAPGSG